MLMHLPMIFFEAKNIFLYIVVSIFPSLKITKDDLDVEVLDKSGSIVELEVTEEI